MTLGQSHRTLREIVADEIQQMIMRGELVPGERLLEDRLAEQLGVSRNPVREALRVLETTGLVEVLPRRGAYVSTLDPASLRQLLELRGVLETYAARLAALHRTEEQVAELEQVIGEGRQATLANDLVHASGCHRRFHEVLEAASQNAHLSNVVAPLRNQTEVVFSVLQDDRGLLAWDEHEAIFRAIAAQDAEAAERATAEHMTKVVEGLTQRAAPRCG